MKFDTIMLWGHAVWMGLAVSGVCFFVVGCRRGLIRAATSLGGLLLGGGVGLIVGKLASLFLGGLPWPPQFTGLGVGLVVAMSIYALVSRVSDFIYEILDELIIDLLSGFDSIVIEYGNALSGGVVDLIFGLLLMWAMLTMLVASGDAAEAEMMKSGQPPNWMEQTLVLVRNEIEGRPAQAAAAPAPTPAPATTPK